MSDAILAAANAVVVKAIGDVKRNAASELALAKSAVSREIDSAESEAMTNLERYGLYAVATLIGIAVALVVIYFT